MTSLFYLYYKKCEKEERKRQDKIHQKYEQFVSMMYGGNLEGMDDSANALTFMINLIPMIIKLIQHIPDLIMGALDVVIGLGLQGFATFQTIGYVAEDVVSFFTTVFTHLFTDGAKFLKEFFIPWLQCAMQKAGDFKSCIFYYVLEMIGKILYLPVLIFIWFFQVLSPVKINMQKYVNMFWKIMERIDRFVFKIGKFHIIHYPDHILSRCYRCDGANPNMPDIDSTPYVNFGQQVVHHWFVDIPKAEEPPIEKLSSAMNHLIKALT